VCDFHLVIPAEFRAELYGAARFVGGTVMSGKQRPRRRLAVEGLEGREMLSINPVFHKPIIGGSGAGHDDVAHFGPSIATAIAASNATASNETHLVANLTNNGNAAGRASYEAETEHGASQQQLSVEVKGATSNATLNVTIDGNVIGTLVTDASGQGKARFANNPTKANVQALPDNFTLNAASTIAIGDTISGSFAAPAPGGDGHDHENEGSEPGDNETELHASLTNNGVAAGEASYHAETENGVTHQSLRVKVTGLGASTTFNVTVDGTVIGTLKTDANGNVKARFSSNPKSANVMALPANFTLSPGSTIMVGDTVIGTFA